MEVGATLTRQRPGAHRPWQVCALRQAPLPSTWRPPRPGCCAVLCLEAPAPRDALSPALRGLAQPGRRCVCSLRMAKSGCMSGRRHNGRGRERPLGRMFHQLWADSVNIKQPLASQTRFQTGTCNPLPQPSREARGSPACCGEETLCRRPWCVAATEAGSAGRQGPAHLNVTTVSAAFSPVSSGARRAGMMTNTRLVLAKVRLLSGCTCTSPFLLTHSLRSPKSLAPHAQDSVSASAVLSPAPLLENHGRCRAIPATHPSRPNRGTPKLVRHCRGSWLRRVPA